MVNNKTAMIRGCTAFWHARNYDAAGNSGNGQFRNMGRTPASAVGALPLLNSSTASQQPKRLTARGLWLPGSSANYASTPDSAALSVTGDADTLVRVQLPDYTPASAIVLAAQYTSAGNQKCWRFGLLGSGAAFVGDSTDGSADAYNSSVGTSPGLTDGAVYWLRLKRDVDNGSGKREYTVYWAADSLTIPASWTSFGSISSLSAGTLFDSSAVLEIGSVNAGASSQTLGTIFRVIHYNGFHDAGGTKVLDVNFTKPGNGATSFTCDTGQAVTINRSSSGLKSTLLNGEASSTLVFDGSDDFANAADDDLLDFGASESATWFALVRNFGAALAYGRWLSKGSDAASGGGYQLMSNNTTRDAYALVADGTNQPLSLGSVPSDGSLVSIAGIRDVSQDKIFSALDGTLNAGTTDSTTGSLANALGLFVGRRANTSGTYQNFSGAAFAVARRALTATGLKRLKAEAQFYGMNVAA